MAARCGIPANKNSFEIYELITLDRKINTGVAVYSYSKHIDVIYIEMAH